MRLIHNAPPLVLALTLGGLYAGLTSLPAQAALILSQTQGSISTSSGYPYRHDFDLDYNQSPLNRWTPEVIPVSLTIVPSARRISSSSPTPNQFYIQLDSGPEIYSFNVSSNSGTTQETIYFYHNPAYSLPVISPGIIVETMPQAWMDEVADGVLSGKLWAAHDTATQSTPIPTSLLFRIGYSYDIDPQDVPEPATGIVFVAGLAVLTSRRRRGPVS